jgi:hypothetical protein
LKFEIHACFPRRFILEAADVPVSGEPILKARGLWKVFGENPERLLKSDLKDESKEKIQEETGLVVGGSKRGDLRSHGPFGKRQVHPHTQPDQAGGSYSG